MNDILQIRIDDKLKQQASKIFKKIGVDLSTAVRMFLKKAVQAEGIPFSLNDSDDYDYISAMDNIYAMQEEARKSGAANMTLDEINAEIQAYREGCKPVKYKISGGQK